MQFVHAFLILTAHAAASEVQSNPLGKVFELMNALEAKIKSEGEAEAKAFKEFFEWCDDASKNTNFEIKTATDKAAKLTAQIGELESDITVGTSKIEDLSAAISTADAELKEASSVRAKAAADFAASEKELMATVDTLERATGILQKEMSKGGAAALAQIDTNNMQNLLQSLSAVVDAAAFSSNDKTKLLALVQSHQSQSEDADDAELGAPAAAKYESKSGGIVELLEDLREKAEGELGDARKAESQDAHNFSMLKQSLEDAIAANTKDMDEEKSGVAEATEGKSAATGDLANTEKALENAKAALKTATSDCMRTAADHEATVAARIEELKVIAQVEKILKESTGAAEENQYGFFLQVSSQSRAELANNEVLSMIKKLAQQHHSAALSQLASRISAVARYGESAGADPFAKVRGLIEDMLSKLQKAAESEASEKAYCDEQMSKTEAKKEELSDDIAKLTSKIDKAAARSAELKEEVATTQSDLAALAKTQAEMDKTRADENAAYTKAKTELTAGLEGVRKALGVLREYYGGGAAAAAMLQDDSEFGAFMQQPAKPVQHEKAGGAGSSIISILEVVESDFADNLAKEETQESNSADSYAEITQQNKVTKTEQDQDVKFKGAEAATLDKSISELTGDRSSTQTEEAAVLEYYAKIKERCVAKPESYEERKARREAEINGLKEALSVLENETAFVQRRHRVRGARFMQA
jgi:hypothetical protein